MANDRDLYDQAADRDPTVFWFDRETLGWWHPASDPLGDVQRAADAAGIGHLFERPT